MTFIEEKFEFAMEDEEIIPENLDTINKASRYIHRKIEEMAEEADRMLKPRPYPGEKVLYTGDLFRIDEEGYLYFVARKDDIIKSRGEKVSPKEVRTSFMSSTESWRLP